MLHLELAAEKEHERHHAHERARDGVGAQAVRAMVDRPYRRPPKPNDDRTTDGTSRLTSLFVSPPFSSTNAPMSTTTAESAVMM